MQARSKTVVMRCRREIRKRGLSTLEVAGCALAVLSMALVAGFVFFAPERGKQPGSAMSDAVVFIAGSGSLYKRAEADAKAYVNMMNSAGPMAQAMDGVGGLPNPVAADSVKQLFNLQSGQP